VTKRLTGIGEALVASATLAVGVASALLAVPDQRIVGVVVGVGVLLGGVTTFAVGSLRRHGVDPADGQAVDGPAMSPPGDERGEAEWSVLVRWGDEPPAVATASIELAARVAPVVVAAVGRAPDDLADLAVRVVVGADPAEAFRLGVEAVTTPIVLVASARAVPDPDACAAAAARLVGGGASWYVGRSEPIGAGTADPRTEVGARLRAALGRVGVWTWEPDAVLVDTGLLVSRPPFAGRPLGGWLRARAAEGHTGLGGDRCLARRAEPTGGAAHAAFVGARRRALVADLVTAAREHRGSGRLAAGALAARELDAVALLAVSTGWWSTLLTGRTPWGSATLPYLAVAAVVLAGRWRWVRRVVGVPASGWGDLRSTIAGLPSSLLALPAVVRRRPLAVRAPAPTRPLLSTALVVAAVAGAGLVDQASGVRPSAAAVAVALSTLVVLWGLGVRALVDRASGRQAVRVRADAAVRVGSGRGRLLDASVAGMAVRFDAGSAPWQAGDDVEVDVEVAPGATWTTRARVVTRRRRHGATVLGLALPAPPPERGPWLDLVVRAVAAPEVGTRPDRDLASPDPGEVGVRRRAWADVALAIAGVAVTVLVVGSLGLVLAGYQPLVVRSASMAPTLGIGDLTIDEPVPASAVRPGDIVTRPVGAGWSERLTHRVRAVRPVGDGLEITTQGDANPFGERWTVAPSAILGRTVVSIPGIGAPALLLRTVWLRASVVALVVVWVVAALARPRRVSSRRASAAW